MAKPERGLGVKRLAPWWFVLRDVRDGATTRLVQPRFAVSWLKGAMTRREIRSLAEPTLQSSPESMRCTASDQGVE